MAVSGDLVTNLVVNSRQFGPGLANGRKEIAGFVNSVKSSILPLSGLIVGALGTRESIAAAQVQVGAERKLEAVLLATGNAAGLSAQQIKDFASARQDLTNFGDEGTIAGAAILATFKEVKGSVFTDSIALAQDMSAVMDQDLKGSVVQLGKALNDPIKGVSALSDVGVSFTQQQKEQIKALQESGDMLGAQGIILAELRSEFGGAAEAMADPLTQMTNMVGDLAENVGFVLLPSIRELYSGFKEGLGPLTANSQAFKDFGEWIAGGVAFIMDYGKHIVAAGVAIGTIVVVTNSVRMATQAWAMAQLMVQALSGPSGWIKLGAGLAIYGAAVAQLTPAFESADKAGQQAVASAKQYSGAKGDIAAVRSEVNQLTGALNGQQTEVDKLFQKYRDGAQELTGELQQIRGLVNSGALTADQGELFSSKAIDQASGIRTRLQDLRDDIALLKGETNETALEMSKLYQKGAPLPLLTELQQLIAQRDELQAQEEAAKQQKAEQERLAKEAKANQAKGLAEELADAKRRAEGYRESLKTEQERFQERVADYNLQVSLGNLTQTQRDELVARDQRELDGKSADSATAKTGPNTALDAGSSESLSQLAQAFNGAGTVSVQERSARTQERIEAYQRRIAELTERQNTELAKQAAKKLKVAKMG